MSAPLPPRSAGPGRPEVVAILASFGERTPQEVPEDVDSMELAWLVHRLEQAYGGTVPESALVRMTTVSAVVEEMAALVEAGAFAGPQGSPRGGAPAADLPADAGAGGGGGHG